MRIKIFLLLMIFFMTVSAGECETVTAMKKCKYDDPYQTILNMRKIMLNDAEIKLFETGTGTEQINGNNLVLVITPFEFDSTPRSWYTNINIFRLDSVKAKKNKILIKGIEHKIVDGTRKDLPVKILITFTISETGELSDKINVIKQNKK